MYRIRAVINASFVDNLTKRYNSVGDANLTADKDGYEYQYDYENRIVKITKV